MNRKTVVEKTNAVEDLDSLLDRLESAEKTASTGDAIDAVLAGAPRITAVRSLRDDEVMRRFRQELADGMVRADTARQALSLIRLAVDAMLK